jgi:hypothetical protein
MRSNRPEHLRKGKGEVQRIPLAQRKHIDTERSRSGSRSWTRTWVRFLVTQLVVYSFLFDVPRTGTCACCRPRSLVMIIVLR